MSARTNVHNLAYSLLCTFLVSVIVAIGVMVLCFVAIGGGHGTNVPGLLFFAPAAVLWMLAGGSNGGFYFVLLFAIVLYSIYGVMIGVGRKYRFGIQVLGVVLAIQYGSAIVTFLLAPIRHDWADLSSFAIVIQGLGVTYSIALSVCFVVIHLVAFQYAWSEVPYRPRLNRKAGVVLCLGFVAGIVLHVVASMQAQY